MIDRTFKDLPEDVKKAWLHDNVVALFNLNGLNRQSHLGKKSAGAQCAPADSFVEA